MQVYDDDDLHGGQRSSEVKCDVLWLPNSVKRIPDASFWWWWPSWRSKVIRGYKVVNYALWIPNLVRRIPDASLKWWWPSWRSKVIKGQMGKVCAMATIFGQKNHWCKFKMMMTFMEFKGHMGSNTVNYIPWLQNLVRQSVMTMMTCIEVKGQQRSNLIGYVIWLSHLVRYTANTR